MLCCSHPFNGAAGKSNGKGYYIYEKGSKPKPDPSVLPIIEESRKLANVMPGGKVFPHYKNLYRSILRYDRHDLASSSAVRSCILFACSV